MSIARYCKHYNLLFSPDLVQRVYERQPKYAVQVDKGLSVRDEAQRAYRLARAAWHTWQADATETHQRQYICHILEKVLGYSHMTECPTGGIAPEVKDTQDLFGPIFKTDTDHGMHLFPISLLLGAGTNRPVLPVIIAPADKSLDDKVRFATGQHLSATQMMQAFLNASEYFTWAIVTNGCNWRLLRDNPALSRPCYLDIDLDRLLEDEDSTAFDGLFWNMLHVSRAARQISDNGETCVWESWRQDLEEHGARARDGLREGVENAICQLGTGFLRGHGPGNDALRAALQDGTFTTQAFYQELMRTVYRLIFLTVLESRNILHEYDKTLKEQAMLYHRGYSISRLIKRMLREEADSRHDDLWQAQLIVFRSLAKDGGEPALALPALGGLYDAHQCQLLDACRLPNRAFLAALRSLCWTNTEGKRTQVDYAHLGAEELGSVYESLLELTPRISTERQIFYFTGGSSDPEKTSKKQKGNARKLTGSYYTPTCLVEQVLKTSLDPLLEDCCKNPVYAKQKLLALRVIDPACGSGHFLLGAARRIAERLADARTPGQMGGATPDVFHRAMHEVIRHCIYGVDINPMAVELVRMNLWLEGYEPGKPLSFLDDHLRCGDSLLGLLSAETFMQFPIPGEAFKPAPGDDKDACKQLGGTNRQSARDYIKSTHTLAEAADLKELEAAYSENSPSEVRQYAGQWQEVMQQRNASKQAVAADIWLGAFLVPKNSSNNVPTTATLNNFRSNPSIADGDPAIQAARHACRSANAFHWFLEFPEVMKNGGFDCVLGNPPWEIIQLKEEEWFAGRNELIAQAVGDTRKRYILLLSQGKLAQTIEQRTDQSSTPDSNEIRLYKKYLIDYRVSNVASIFYHVKGEVGGRFALTGQGKVNMFALFAETAYRLRKDSGRIGIIVPTNIITDISTHVFFNHLISNKQLHAVYDFRNNELFPNVCKNYKFAILSITPYSTITDIACYMTHPRQLDEKERHVHVQGEDLARFNPNTGTCPLFRCSADAELTTKIYRSVPILCNEKTGENSWDVSFKQGLFNMTSDSHLFHETREEGMLPLYEGKMIHHYDHRFNTFESTGGNAKESEVTAEQKRNPYFEPSPRYWVRREDVLRKLPKCCKQVPEWLIGFRDICRATDERTFIVSFIPFSAVNNKLPLIFLDHPTEIQCVFVANGSSLISDYIVRQKLGGTSLNFFYVKQLPFLPPTDYSEQDLAYISQRVLELTYTSYSMKPLAKALGYEGEPYAWDEERRAELKAELDAYYAKLYGLTREELAYILDPTVKYPEKCPTVTFPGLRAKEEKKYGEYRTQRLVMAAFDNLSQQGK